MLLAHERHVRLEREMEEASRDEMFLGDIKATMEDFKHADAETAMRVHLGLAGSHSLTSD